MSTNDEVKVEWAKSWLETSWLSTTNWRLWATQLSHERQSSLALDLRFSSSRLLLQRFTALRQEYGVFARIWRATSFSPSSASSLSRTALQAAFLLHNHRLLITCLSPGWTLVIWVLISSVSWCYESNMWDFAADVANNIFKGRLSLRT